VPQRPSDQHTQFLNVDVDVWSTADLRPLVAAMGKRIHVHHAGEERGAYATHFSLASADTRDANTRIRRLIALIEKLPSPARRLWDRARRRDFNIGIQAGVSPFSHDIALDETTVALVAGVRARIVVTTYAVEQDQRNRPLSRRRRTFDGARARLRSRPTKR